LRGRRNASPLFRLHAVIRRFKAVSRRFRLRLDKLVVTSVKGVKLRYLSVRAGGVSKMGKLLF